MKRFHVSYRTSTGSLNSRLISAENVEEAEGIARFEGIWPEKIIEEKGRSIFLKPFGWVSLGELYHFTWMFAALTRAGFPILEALDFLAERSSHGILKVTLRDIFEKIQSGSGMKAAFAAHPTVFDLTYQSLVGIGEETGELNKILSRLRDLIGRKIKLRRDLIHALSYPIIVLGLSILIVWAILKYIVPKFVEIYGRYGEELPGLTQFVISCSDFVIKYTIQTLVVILLIIILGYFIRNTRWGKPLWDRVILYLPIAGPMIHDYDIAHFARSFSILFHSGVPLLTALEILIPTVERVPIREAIVNATQEISSGKSIGESFLAQEPWFPDVFNRMLIVGERSGFLSEMLDHIADYYEESFNKYVDTLTTLIEPFLIVFLGGIIAIITIALYLPIFALGKVILKR